MSGFRLKGRIQFRTVLIDTSEAVGGAQTADQTGCVVTYASFRDTSPPPDDSLFSDTEDSETEAGCVNPAAIAGGKGTLDPYFPGEVRGVFTVATGPSMGPYANPDDFDPIATPFFKMPDFVEAECVARDGFNYLEISVMADPEDPRADDFTGDFLMAPQWGLHLVDVTLAMGNLVSLAESQGAAWVAANVEP